MFYLERFFVSQMLYESRFKIGEQVTESGPFRRCDTDQLSKVFLYVCDQSQNFSGALAWSSIRHWHLLRGGYYSDTNFRVETGKRLLSFLLFRNHEHAAT